MLRYYGHTVWLTSKIIARLVRVGSLVSAAPNIINLVQGKHPQISGDIGVWCGKVGDHAEHLLSYNISETASNINRKLLLTAYIKSYTRYRFLPFCGRPINEIRLFICGYICQPPLKVSDETNCLHTLYRSKFTAVSRNFPATAQLSCYLIASKTFNPGSNRTLHQNGDRQRRLRKWPH